MQIKTKDNQIVIINPKGFMQFSSYYCQQSVNQANNDTLTMDIKSDILLKINNFLSDLLQTQITQIPKPIPNGKLETFLNVVEANFIKSLTKLEREQILKAAQYLEIKHLIDLIFASYAADFIKMTTNEFIQYAELNVQYTTELENEIKQHYQSLLKQ